jgi:hypothetical protein
MSAPKVATAIVCEDVRIEKSGKHIIIGVYPSDIIIQETPAQIPVLLWLQIDDVGSNDKSFDFRISISGKNIVKGKFIVSTRGVKNRATIPLGPFPLTINEEGDLKFDVHFSEGGRWRNAITMPVKIRPPTAQLPPS